MNLIDLIQKISRSDEIMAKIRAAVVAPDTTPLPPFVGIGGVGSPLTTTCNTSYDLPINSSFDFKGLIDSGLGPVPGDACSHINTITGLVDFDTSQAPDSFGAVVNLVLQMDGAFK